LFHWCSIISTRLEELDNDIAHLVTNTTRFKSSTDIGHSRLRNNIINVMSLDYTVMYTILLYKILLAIIRQ